MSNIKHNNSLEMNVLRRHKSLPLGVATAVGVGSVYFIWRRWFKNVDYTMIGRRKLLSVKDAVDQSRKIVQHIKESSGCPGVAVAVSLNGSIVWKQGFGYADTENKVPCTPHSVMKTASISKAISSVLLGKLWEMGLVSLDTDIINYVKYWPQKYWKEEKVALTIKQLATHTAGIRDYKPIKHKSSTESSDSLDFDYEEYYIKETFRTVKESVSIFKDDPLISKPGEEFHYTTHGYTLLSACLEGATGKDFATLVYNLYKDLGLTETYLDNDKQQIIYNRSHHYVKGQSGTLQNASFTESSFKLAGAGMLSTVLDLAKFGDIVLYSFQRADGVLSCKPGYLKADTVKVLWQPIKGTEISWHPDGQYGMGWQIAPYNKNRDVVSNSLVSDRSSSVVNPAGKDEYKMGRFVVGHTGGTVGASSALMILPSDTKGDTVKPPSGVVVVILANLQGISLGKVAVDIAGIFDDCLPAE